MHPDPALDSGPRDTGDGPDGPWPARYEDVADAYNALRDQAFVDILPLFDLFFAGEVEAFYDALSDEMKALVTLEDLQSFYEQIAAGGAVGDASVTRAMGIGREMRVYSRYPWEGDLDLGMAAAAEDNTLTT